MSNKYLPSGLYQLESESKYNVRYKFIPAEDGSLNLYEEMYSNRYIFNPHHVEEHNRTHRIKREMWAHNLDLMYGFGDHYVSDKGVNVNDNLKRSQRRAKSNLLDYALCNNFTCFVTLTLSDKKIDRADYKAICSKISVWLDNRVRRKGLVYVGVPEFHKDGAIHFHLLCNDVLDVVDSGTVVRPCGKKPVKKQTAINQGYKLEECRTVYNITDWTLGFSTMLYTYGDVRAVANYIVKYITKSDNKVGGRWYYSGGKLLKPVYLYDRVSFNDVNEYDYDFECDGGKFKIKRY